MSTNCSDLTDNTPAWVAPEGPVTAQETWGFEYKLSKDGVVQATVQAGHMTRYQTENIFRLNAGVTVKFYRADGTVGSTVRSDSAVVEVGGAAFTAYQQVQAVSDSGIVLTSDHLRWEKARDQVFTDHDVTVRTKTDTLYGRGFQADPNLSTWQIRESRGVSGSRLRLE